MKDSKHIKWLVAAIIENAPCGTKIEEYIFMDRKGIFHPNALWAIICT